MKALSVRQPWAYLIVHSLKDIENRVWSTTYRGPLLIHASLTPDALAFRVLSHRMGLHERGGIVGVVTLADVVTESESPWFEGPYGFVLRDARSLPFVAVRGISHLFEVHEVNV